MYSGGKLAN